MMSDPRAEAYNIHARAWRALFHILTMWGVASLLVIWPMILVGSIIERHFAQSGAVPQLVVMDLGFRDGRFHQRVQPSYGAPIFAQWTASIIQGNDLQCAGTGWADYEISPFPVSMLPEVWAGPGCNLQAGVTYTAAATWAWEDEHGTPHRTSLRLTFIYPNDTIPEPPSFEEENGP